jgi:hypothetical protein
VELNEHHWTDDPELIERFVLNRLNPDERNELEGHLRICEICKQAVRAEQLLIAGIRRSGREQFKAALKKKVEETPEKRIPWMHVLSAAAVVLIILSVGIYNRWFELQKPPEQIASPPQPSVVEGDQNKDQRVGEDKIVEQRHPPSPPVSEQTTEQKRREGLAEALRRKESGRESGVESAREDEAAAGAGAAAREEPPTLQPTQPATHDAVIASSASEGMWLEGTILPSGDGEGRVRIEEKQAAPKAYNSAQHSVAKSSVRAQSIESTPFLLRQHSVHSLPPAQQQLQQQQEGNGVMTRVVRLGEKTQLTLYLDSLVDAAALQSATIETPTADSLILTVANQRIAYKLPAGWNEQWNITPAK